jgi:hypothetical protein
MMPRYPIIIGILIGTVLICGCTDSIFTGSLNITSDPEGAEVYIDAEYRGETPCVVRNLDAGNHSVQLRHDKYPDWEMEILVERGEEKRITADLSENLIPEIILDFEGSGAYPKGDEVLLFGSAVTADDSVTLIIEQIRGESTFATQIYRIPLDEEAAFEYGIDTADFTSGTYQITANLSTGEQTSRLITILTEAETNIAIVREIVRDYHATHTYSTTDIFVCADMALDVWNMVETRGINAKIAIGDVKRSDEKLFEANHAWVLAETSPDEWTALETTGGYIVTGDEEYYTGWFFEGSREFKTYISLLEQYNAQSDEIDDARDRYNDKVDEYNAEVEELEYLTNTYNRRYVGQNLTYTEYQAALSLKDDIAAQETVVVRISGELDQALEDLEEEYATQDDIYDQMLEQIE